MNSTTSAQTVPSVPYGEGDKFGSVLLTAYMLKMFQQANSIMTIDESVLVNTVSLIGSHGRSDGSITEVGVLHHKTLASSSLQDDGTTGGKSVYLTAYTIMALLQKPLASPGSSTGTTNATESKAHLYDGVQAQTELFEKPTRPGDRRRLINVVVIVIGGSHHLQGDNYCKHYEPVWRRSPVIGRSSLGQAVSMHQPVV